LRMPIADLYKSHRGGLEISGKLEVSRSSCTAHTVKGNERAVGVPMQRDPQAGIVARAQQ